MYNFLTDNHLWHLYVTIENYPNTYFKHSANFCFYNMDEIFYIRYYAIVMWCQNLYSGQYLLLNQKFFPNVGNVIRVREIYVYGKITSSTDLQGSKSYVK